MLFTEHLRSCQSTRTIYGSDSSLSTCSSPLRSSRWSDLTCKHFPSCVSKCKFLSPHLSPGTNYWASINYPPLISGSPLSHFPITFLATVSGHEFALHPLCLCLGLPLGLDLCLHIIPPKFFPSYQFPPCICLSSCIHLSASSALFSSYYR